MLSRHRVQLTKFVSNPYQDSRRADWPRSDPNWPIGTVFVVIDEEYGQRRETRIERPGKHGFVGFRHTAYQKILDNSVSAAPRTFEEFVGMYSTCAVGPSGYAVLRHLVDSGRLTLSMLRRMIREVDE